MIADTISKSPDKPNGDGRKTIMNCINIIVKPLPLDPATEGFALATKKLDQYVDDIDACLQNEL